ncbi:S-layer homology domain-containing protein [uncultured Dialister sp.]|uniref:S-layer homology domain-containing protein n=1 Tax=uncultured Dialister sp. TaxID=278064 RepID=UPI0025DFAE71|nr:S-layer homology domain-containing protein [uncultured Dialister sp.]
MKKILAIAAVAALTAGVSAYAANPFSDVTPDDWAYQAVSDLSDQGVVEGYPDGTFKGERNMTRYELAQIIARLMAKEDQLNAEQRATLDKLAGEYADELANLGVRVGNLEKKVGNIYWSGDARMRYRDNSVGNDTWDGRMRINVEGQVNDTTTVNGRLTYNMNFKDSTKDSGVYMDTLNVKHQFGDFAVTLGRYANNFGNEYSWRFGDSHNFDGAELSYAKDAFNAKVGFGQWDTDYTVDQKAAMDDQDAFYAKAGYDFNFAKLGVDYVKFQGNNTAKQSFSGNDELLGVDLSIPFAQKWAVLGEYVKNTNTQFSKDDAWNAGISYGVANWKKPGTFNINVMYNDIGGATYFGGTGIGTDMLDNLKDGNKELKFWNIGTDVTLAKNVQLHGEYAFDADLTNSEDPDDAWTVSLNYKF